MVDDLFAHVLPDKPILGLDDYLAGGGGKALDHALELSPAEVIDEVVTSGLRGRGGAGFPTGVKWRSVAEAGAAGETVYLVCNGAEGEPGTYKDRALMARNPYQLVEGLCIGLYALGAELAFIGTKQRFGDQVKRVVEARDAMAEAGFAGADRIRIAEGSDEYLFGEEKALLEVIEGKLPLPRILPPYQTGLFANMQHPNPTVVNNVESLSHVTRILARGASFFRAEGTEESPGTMVFTLIGDVPSPGLYELPLGTPVRTLVCEVGGADPDDILAVYSGTSNSVMTPDVFDLPMDFDSFAEAGTGLGSGGFVVYDTSRDIVQVCAALERFLAVESCGQCNACKLGNVEMSERLDKLVRGEGTAADIAEIRKRTETVTDQNRCYLPVGAALVVRSTLDTFPESFEARIGSPSPADRHVAVPKINWMDLDTGEYELDPDYHRKQLDWSYAP